RTWLGEGALGIFRALINIARRHVDRFGRLAERAAFGAAARQKGLRTKLPVGHHALPAKADRPAGRQKAPVPQRAEAQNATDLLAGFLTWAASRSAQITTVPDAYSRRMSPVKHGGVTAEARLISRQGRLRHEDFRSLGKDGRDHRFDQGHRPRHRRTDG